MACSSLLLPSPPLPPPPKRPPMAPVPLSPALSRGEGASLGWSSLVAADGRAGVAATDPVKARFCFVLTV